MTVPNTLFDIRIKIRRLVRAPTEAQISDAQLDRYINTFVLYDFPEQLRLFTLREEFNFYTIPDVDVYDSSNTDYDPNVYTSIHPPVYVSGYQCLYSQSREQFYRIYPKINFSQDIAQGDGITVSFSNTLSNVPILKSNLTLGSVDISGNRLLLIDDGLGNLTGDGTGTVNYITGAISLSFNTAPAIGIDITAQSIPYVSSRPDTVLFFDNKFTLRPVPNAVYKVNMEVYKRPTELISSGQTPELEQWWQYIAYGAAKKIFEDRGDLDSVQLIMPEFMNQQRLVLRRTISQQTSQRTSTIYTNQNGFLYGLNNRGFF